MTTIQAIYTRACQGNRRSLVDLAEWVAIANAPACDDEPLAGLDLAAFDPTVFRPSSGYRDLADAVRAGLDGDPSPLADLGLSL